MERRYLILLVWVLLNPYLLGAQNEVSPYLFNEFQDATVFLKGHNQSKEKMNYSLLSNRFLFIDKSTGEIKEVSNIEDVIIIRFGDRSFYPEKEGGVEVIPMDDVTLYVQYRIKSRVEAPKGAYGGSTETASVSAYAGVYADNKYTNFEPQKLIPGTRYNYYWIEKNNKKKQFITFKQFLKVYPKHKTVLESFIRENNIKFEDVDMIKKLCLYAEGL